MTIHTVFIMCNRLLARFWRNRTAPCREHGEGRVLRHPLMTPFLAPNRLHVWYARRPLVACREAVLASLLPLDADRKVFLHAIDIHGDPLAAKARIAEATRRGALVPMPVAVDGLSSIRRAPSWFPTGQRWAQIRDNVEASDCLTCTIACWRSVVDVGAAA